jgi:hypothetical protein
LKASVNNCSSCARIFRKSSSLAGRRVDLSR